MSLVYNLNFCGICQSPSKLDLINTSTVTIDGIIYLELLEFIFNDISWVGATLFSACNICIKKIENTAEFKRTCLESNNRNKALNTKNFKCNFDYPNDNLDELHDDILELKDNDLPANDENIKVTKRKSKRQNVSLENDLKILEDKLNGKARNVTKRKTRKQVNLENDKLNGEAENIPKRSAKRQRALIDQPTEKGLEKHKTKKIEKHIEDIEESEKEVSKTKDFSCEFCPTTFHIIDKFDRHMFKHNGIRKYICNVCDTKFITTQDLSAHKRLWCTESKTSCSLCPGKTKRFSPELLAVHMKVEHMVAVSKEDSHLIDKDRVDIAEDGPGGVGVEAGKCSIDKKRRKKLKQKILTCHICQMEFTRSTHLDKHVYNHDGSKNHDCHDCGTKFITTDDLRNHKRVVHLRKEDYKFLCMECGARFPISSGLQMHILRSHTNNRNFTCDICHKSFYQKRDVENHLTTHSNRREFKCDLCPAEYKRKQVLQVHKFKAHGIGVCRRKAVDKYKCPFCMKIISSKAKLPRHIRTHTGVKPFKCRLCDSKFTCNSYVKNHVKQKHHVNVEASDFSANLYYEICEIGDPVEENAGIRVNGDEDDEHITCDV